MSGMNALADPALMPTGRTMRAALLTGTGGPEVVRIGEAPVPAQLHSELLVRVAGAGVNPIDAKTRAGGGAAGAIPSFPATIGNEFSGVVARTSHELAEFQPGDEVYGMVLYPRYSGAWAEYVSTPALCVARKPESLDLVEAGAVPLAALTAWAAVIDAGRVRSGCRVLVHAGAGGVGHLAVQLAHYYGAHVIATASAANRDWLLELGADEAVDYRAQRFEDAVTEPVDLVVDLVGNVRDDTGSRSLRVLRDGGTIVNVPTGSWPTMLEEAAAEDRGIVASTLKLQPDGRILETIAQLFDQGALRTRIERVFPLAEAGTAQALVEAGHVRGKVVIDVRA